MINADGVAEPRYQGIEPDANGDFRPHVETLWQATLPTVEQALDIIRQMLAAK